MANNDTRPAHTPGPWHVEPATAGRFLVQLDDGSTIATVGEGWHEGGSDEQLDANARLIAAAPDLLEALDYLLEQTLDMDLAVGNELDEKQSEARQMALAAMAKADGQR
jgi:hypothetical protein